MSDIRRKLTAVNLKNNVETTLNGVGYSSPVELIAREISYKIEEQCEGLIMNAVQDVGVEVNKAELLKALQYDRHQYEKGYSSGYINGAIAIVKKIKEKLWGPTETWLTSDIVTEEDIEEVFKDFCESHGVRMDKEWI